MPPIGLGCKHLTRNELRYYKLKCVSPNTKKERSTIPGNISNIVLQSHDTVDISWDFHCENFDDRS